MPKNNKKTIINKQSPLDIFVGWLKRFAPAIAIIGIIVLAGLIFWSRKITPDDEPQEPLPEQTTFVELYQPGQSYLTTQAKVTDEGVITVVAQSSGVVQRVNISEGQKVRRGQQLASLSSNYQGANASALQLELAEKNWLMTHANYWDQEKVDDINHELNQNTAWVTRWETNPSRSLGGNGDAYTSFSGLQNQELLNLSETMTQRGQQLSLDQAENNYFAAQIVASLMYPATPVAGSIEKVYVKVGDIIAAGSPVAIIKSDKADVKLELSVPEHVIRNLSLTAPAWFTINGTRQEVNLDFIPTTPTTGNSYFLTMTLSPEVASLVANGTYIDINLPLDTVQDDRLLLPLNAIYQTQDHAYAYVVDVNEDNQPIAKQKEVTLGAVIGTLVTVESGVQAQDRIILNNNLLDGDRITFTLEQHSADSNYPILNLPMASMSAITFLE